MIARQFLDILNLIGGHLGVGVGNHIPLLIRARRDSKNIVGFGLSEHFRHIFEITRLDQVISIYATEESALAFAGPHNLPEREN